MLGFEPLSDEPISGHYVTTSVRRWIGALRVRLRGLGARLRVTLWRIGPRA